MQPVLLGRSFAPLQGETGLCTAATCSSRQKHRASVSLLRRGETKGRNFSPSRQEVRVNSEGPECFFSSEEMLVSSSAITFAIQFLFLPVDTSTRKHRMYMFYYFLFHIYRDIYMELVLQLP